MSAPTPAPGDDRPREGYYPDPSIPGYVRYWNGASWVAGTSRPAPKDGEPLAPPPGVRPAAPAVASVEETGPHFFDEDPVEEPSAGASQHGSRPEPASAWGADRAGQPGSARVAWPNAQGADPRVPHARTGPGGGAGAGASGEVSGQAPTGSAPPAQAGPTGAAPAHGASPTDRPATGSAGAGPASGDPAAARSGAAGVPASGSAGAGQAYGDPDAAQSAHAGPTATGSAGAGHAYGDPASAQSAAPASGASGSAGAGQAYADPAAAQVAGDGSADGRADRSGVSSGDAGNPAGGAPADAEGGAGSTFVFRRPTAGPQAAPAADEGTITFRAVPPRAAPGAPDASASPGTGGPGFAAGKAAAARAAVQGTAGPQQAPAAAPTALSGPQQASGPAAGSAVPRQAAAPQPQPVQSPPQPAASAPVAVGPGGGQSSWAQQVHQLAGAGGDEQPVVPWKPPVDDVFQAAARRQAAARPAGVGKRLAARLIDTVVLAGVTAVAAVPLGTKAIDHVNDKIDAAKLSGETVTVWLLDGTTATYLGIVLAVLLLFGVVYEALPTAKWGRTLGKKLLGLEVRDIEAHEPPSFGAALRRWLVYSVPGLLAVGVVGVAWCLFDRPWHQCWHDKAAGTFVAG
ncbi:RDD family protein [Streptomyces sp. CL12-4]|nr:RDD family protein [Streptomyces sp. CL12-4]MCG8967309.1 RDD family protein [Streptomyces sp. CL12-4]